MSYCSYCGMSYLKRKCRICGLDIFTCGCDCGRDVCEEHYCLGCDEAYEHLDDDGLCPSCVEKAELDG